MKKILVIKMLVLIGLLVPAFAMAQTSAVNQVSGHLQASLIDAQVVKLSVGDENKFEWRFVSAYKAGTLKIKLMTEEGLQITSSQQEFIFDIKSNGEYKVAANIKALLNGRRYLNFYVHYEGGSQKLDGTTSAVFQVGMPAGGKEKQAENSGVTLLNAVEEVKVGQ